MSTGLGSAEAARRLAEHGPNLAPRPPRRSPARRVLDQLRDPMILMLLGAFVVVAGVGDIADGAIILAVVVLNTTIGVVQEVRAANALDALDRMAAPHAVVVRDGEPVRVAAADVVPGDLVRLEAGDVVPADLDLELAAGLQVDESSMTGESVPVSRREGDELFAGTVVTRGRAHGTVVRTGADSALGAIAAAIASAGVRPTPLQQRLSALSARLVVLTLALAALVFVMGVLRGEDVAHTLVLAVSLAVAAIPESLPAVVTVALALGAYRMARRNALVRRLPAVETLGSVTVLASDKTGTLTEGRMTVRETWTPPGGRPEELLRDLVLCNDADGGGTAGDPMEAALLAAAVRADLAALAVRDRWPRTGEVPFDADTKRMTTLHRGPAGPLLVCKGAPEAVLPLAGDPGDAHAEAHRLADQGYRVLAVADGTPRDDAELTAPTGLTLRGLVALVDPPRESALEVVTACRDAGIQVVMITGDHPATARAIGAELTIPEHQVYARTRPEGKVDIVADWQARGEVVAMTGDGVNDAPALRNADIGVAMGNRGTEVARQAADLVLGDDDLRTVVAAVEEGRRIYTNIRRFLRFGLSGGLAEVLVLLLGPFLGIPLPLTPGQILWINMVTHGVPGVAFGGEPADPADMARPSPSPERSVLGGLVRQIAVTAALITAVSLGVGLAAGSTGEQQTSVFLCLGLAQLWLALALRAPRAGATWRDRGLEGAVLGAAVLLLAAVGWGPLRELLNTAPVTAVQAAVVAAVAVVPALAVLAWSRLAAGVQGPLAGRPPADDTAGERDDAAGG